MEGARGDVASEQRRSANYKANIWKYDLLQSLSNEYPEEEYKRCVEKLKDDVASMFTKSDELISKLELIDSIEKLGLSYLFEKNIKEVLDTIASIDNNNPIAEEGLHASALFFRLVRQHGYNISQDVLQGFVGSFIENTEIDIKAMIELHEASYLATDGENLLQEAKSLSTRILKNICSNVDNDLVRKTTGAFKLPLQWRVKWYDVRRHIHDVEKREREEKATLVKLAKFNFNIIQASHQKDLKELLRWWKNLNLIENLSFTRNRLVESYLWAMGVAFEPQHGSFRKWLTKAIVFVLVIDDIYDIYGSLEELECFTNAVDRWDADEIQHLPECLKICFEALHNTTTEVTFQIQNEKGWTSVLPHLQKAWADFCKALLMEAKWYNEGYTPSLQEYLDNGWTSSSGALLSLHALFSFTDEMTEEVENILSSNKDLVHHTSLIIRLCNDLGTSTAELERGDAPSSVLCHMREAHVSEETARKHMKTLIMDSWKKINHACLGQPPSLLPYAKYTSNMARVVHFIYQHGDGFGVQDRETRDQILSLLIEPLMPK